VIAVSHRSAALQQMALEWGVVPHEIEECRDVEHLWARSMEAARATGLVVPGDRVVITGGTAVNMNLIKVETA
jgi:pyruvate kinase